MSFAIIRKHTLSRTDANLRIIYWFVKQGRRLFFRLYRIGCGEKK